MSSLFSAILGRSIFIAMSAYMIWRFVRPPRVFSTSELALHDGHDASLPLYMAIVGEVFDVTAGKRFYAPDSGSHYAYFSGKDASRAFVTGEFHDLEDGTQPNDVRTLTDRQLLSVERWRKFYHTHPQYKFVGYLHEPNGFGFYDEKGKPLPALKTYQERLKVAEHEENVREALVHQYPSCDSHWSQGKGGKVFCPPGLVPRKGKMPHDLEERCACYELHFSRVHSHVLELFPDCSPEASECVTPP